MLLFCEPISYYAEQMQGNDFTLINGFWKKVKISFNRNRYRISMRSDNALFVYIYKAKWEGSVVEVDMKRFQMDINYQCHKSAPKPGSNSVIQWKSKRMGLRQYNVLLPGHQNIKNSYVLTSSGAPQGHYLFSFLFGLPKGYKQ